MNKVCNDCGMIVSGNEQMSIHRDLNHPQYYCIVCDDYGFGYVTYASIQRYRTHLRRQHSVMEMTSEEYHRSTQLKNQPMVGTVAYRPPMRTMHQNYQHYQMERNTAVSFPQPFVPKTSVPKYRASQSMASNYRPRMNKTFQTSTPRFQPYMVRQFVSQSQIAPSHAMVSNPVYTMPANNYGYASAEYTVAPHMATEFPDVQMTEMPVPNVEYANEMNVDPYVHEQPMDREVTEYHSIDTPAAHQGPKSVDIPGTKITNVGLTTDMLSMITRGVEKGIEQGMKAIIAEQKKHISKSQPSRYSFQRNDENEIRLLSSTTVKPAMHKDKQEQKNHTQKDEKTSVCKGVETPTHIYASTKVIQRGEASEQSDVTGVSEICPELQAMAKLAQEEMIKTNIAQDMTIGAEVTFDEIVMSLDSSDDQQEDPLAEPSLDLPKIMQQKLVKTSHKQELPSGGVIFMPAEEDDATSSIEFVNIDQPMSGPKVIKKEKKKREMAQQ